MTPEETIQIFNNRLNYLNTQRDIAVRCGQLEQILKIDEDILSTEATLLLLNSASSTAA
jgi:hypothetical protein